MAFLPKEDRARQPTYWAICRGVADDPFALELADVVPPPQWRVNVFLAAVHHLLLLGADHELATHYRSVCERRGVPFEPADDDLVMRTFGSFCRAYRDEIAARCLVRATQTNEVGRCSALRAALALLSDRGEAVGLLDVGCSAGLNLLVDAYRYTYDGVTAGPADGRPLLHCELQGGVLPPLTLPRVVARVGLDLSPVDPADATEMAWLLACLWPDDLERVARFEAAAHVARERRGELTMLQGDMVEGLGAAAAATDAEHLVVLNSWSASYLPTARRADLAGAVADVAASRPTTWVSMEFPEVARDLGVFPGAASTARRGASVVCVTAFDGRTPTSAVVAETHPHGRWLDWYDRPLDVSR